MRLVHEIGFRNSFIFKYSPRPGTKAFDRQVDDVPESVKRSRNNRLLEAQTQVSLAGNQSFLGRTVEILIEGLSPHEELNIESLGSAPAADTMVQLVGRTTCDRIVVVDALGELWEECFLSRSPKRGLGRSPEQEQPSRHSMTIGIAWQRAVRRQEMVTYKPCTQSICQVHCQKEMRRRCL